MKQTIKIEIFLKNPVNFEIWWTMWKNSLESERLNFLENCSQKFHENFGEKFQRNSMDTLVRNSIKNPQIFF